MKHLHSLNWVLYIAFLLSIWDSNAIIHYAITAIIVIAYGYTERCIGEENKI